MLQNIGVNQFKMEDLKPGMFVSFEQVLTEERVQAFAELTGDYSPLHVSREYAETTSFGNNVVHGMLIGGLFSRVVGVLLPGQRALLNAMDLKFQKPIFVGNTVTISAKIISVSQAARVITLNLLALVEGEIGACAKASVTVRE